MRVRPLRTTARRTSSAPARRLHVVPKPAPPAESEPSRELKAEQRARASGGPEDRAFYTCECGYAFEASVSTSVSCPHCGTDQAW